MLIRHLSALAAVLVLLLIGLMVKDQMNTPTKTLTIFYTSNLRGQLKPFVGDSGSYQNLKVGGFSYIGGLIDDLLRKYRSTREFTLLLDTGDSLFGSAEASLTMGEAPYTLMEKLGYDAMCLGNMEFEFGIDALRRFAERNRVPMLACNFRDVKAPLGNTFLPGKIIERAGSRIGVIGLGLTDLPRNTRQENILQIEITDARSAVEKTAAQLRIQGAELMVLVAHHPGFDDVDKVAAMFPDVDVVIGDQIPLDATQPGRRPLLCATAFPRGAGLGVVRVPYINGVWEPRRGQSFVTIVDATAVSPHAELAAEVNRMEARVDTLLEEVIAEASTDFRRAFNAESTMGNLLTDIVREHASASVALLNSGAIKAAFAQGAVSLGNLFDILPFENSVVRVTLTGAQLEALIEEGLSGRGSFLQASGIDCTYSSLNPPGFRLIQTMIGEEPLEWDRNYQVAVTDFMVDKQSSWPELGHAEKPQAIGLLREAIKEGIRARGTIHVTTEKRFHDVGDQDETLRQQALSIELASLTRPVTASATLHCEYARLAADVLRTETDSDFAFVPVHLIQASEALQVVSAARLTQDIREVVPVKVAAVTGAQVREILEYAVRNATDPIAFSGLSIETRDGKISLIHPWQGLFDVTKDYKIVFTADLLTKRSEFSTLEALKLQNFSNDLR
ncbi:MAG TPA: bifunctional UDP-sugar hydrolase/5'-nucleotidase, partial [Candidatus Ozemobacteraceae bacterium]|nr:bifunctional UDP-sugar hydrolase/5'-nucleotidase [Candidatus Ozemobacteraceae bacterium]